MFLFKPYTKITKRIAFEKRYTDQGGKLNLSLRTI